MTKSLNIVIPMKGLSRAKQRLKPVLSVEQREALALTLFRNTLQFLAVQHPKTPILVVTEDRYIAQIAEKMGATVLIEQGEQGLNHALEQASQWSLNAGFDSQLILPADIGHLDPLEIRYLIELGFSDAQVVIAAAKDGGTNALMTTPPNAISPSFGIQSSMRHLAQAHQNGLSVKRLTLEKLSLDIDVSADLQYWYQPTQAKEFCYE